MALLTYGSHTTLLMALLYESRDLTRALLQSTRVFAQIGFALAIWYLAAHSGVPVGEPAPVAEPADEAGLPAHSR